MSRRKFSSIRNTAKGTWGKRIDRLIRACGWTKDQWSSHFGMDPNTVREIRYDGRKPIHLIDFIIKLRKLELVHAQELEAFDLGLISYRKLRGMKTWERVDWRPSELIQRSRFNRPEDIATLGQVSDAELNRRLASYSG